MFATTAFQSQLTVNLAQLSSVVNSVRQGSTAAIYSRNRRSSKSRSKKSESEIQNNTKARHSDIVPNKTDIEALYAIIRQQKADILKLVPLFLAGSSQHIHVKDTWRTSHVSSPSFFENKTGFSERWLDPQTSDRVNVVLNKEMHRLLAPSPRVQVQQHRSYFWNTGRGTQGFGLKQSPDSDSADLKRKQKSMTDLLTGEDKRVQSKISEAFLRGFTVNPGDHKEQSTLQKRLRSWWTSLFIFVFLAWLGLKLFSSARIGGGLQETFRLNPDHEINPETVNVTYADVKGCDEAKEELSDIVDYLKNREKYTTMGAQLPKGLLMNGSPGVGKTLLARATAGEAGVPFFQASGSEFDEIFVGSGAKKVRNLFASAKARAPCIIFIDEIDSVGGKRTNSGLHPYANQTVNQLLAEMDGFLPTSGVIVIGATNNRDNLDKALLRPGRFDMEVNILPPDFRGRQDILKLYLNKVQAEDGIDLSTLSKLCQGMTGADLHNVVNQAALQAARQKCKISMQHLLDATDRVLMGPHWKNREMKERVRKNTAYHESGHALVAYYTQEAHNLHKITILPRGQSLGHTQLLGPEDSYDQTRAELLAAIDVCMGGRAAEEIKFGKKNVTTGASSDFMRATALATGMVKNYGMSEKIGLRVHSDSGKDSSPEWKHTIDSEVNKLLDESYRRAVDLLKEHSDELDRLAKAVMHYETLDIDEIKLVLAGKQIKRVPKKTEDSKNSEQKQPKDNGSPNKSPLV